jgi:hypothetical protein
MSLLLPAGGATVTKPPTMDFVAEDGQTADATTWTFTSQAFGDAADDRIMVLALDGGASKRTVNSVTIGGVSAAQQVSKQGGGAELFVEIWSAAVPSGTTGTVVITLAGSTQNMGIGLYRLTGMSATKTDSAVDGAISSGNIELTTTIPANGCGIAVFKNDNNQTSSWTNLDETYDENIGEGSYHRSGASKFYSTLQTDLAITDTPSNNAGSEVACCAAFGPS